MDTGNTIRIPMVDGLQKEWTPLVGDAFRNVGANAEVGFTTDGNPPETLSGQRLLQNEIVTNKKGDIYVLKDSYFHYEFLPIDTPPEVAYVDTKNTYTYAQSSKIVEVPYSSQITIDMSIGNKFRIVLDGDTTITAPDNLTPGQGGVIYVEQGPIGGDNIEWDETVWKFTRKASEDTSTGVVNIYVFETYSDTAILMSYAGGGTL